jgi:hypothetical protein
VLDAEVVEDLADGLIDNVFDGLGLMVKGGHRWQNVGSHIGGQAHQPQMAFVQRRFPDDQNQLALLFQGHIGSPHQQVFVVRVGDARQGFDGAGNHHHALGEKRSAGYRSGEVLGVIDEIGHGRHLARRIGSLDLDVQPAGFGNDQVGFIVGVF